MFKCAGWCVIDDMYFDNEEGMESYKRIENIANEIKSKWGNVFSNLSVDWVNAHCFLTFHSARNHGSTMHKPIEELAKFITKRAPRSYGVIHVYDDELPDQSNVFHVIKIAGPKLIHETDAVLAAVDKMDEVD
jgi:hypothetical protein